MSSVALLTGNQSLSVKLLPISGKISRNYFQNLRWFTDARSPSRLSLTMLAAVRLGTRPARRCEIAASAVDERRSKGQDQTGNGVVERRPVRFHRIASADRCPLRSDGSDDIRNRFRTLHCRPNPYRSHLRQRDGRAHIGRRVGQHSSLQPGFRSLLRSGQRRFDRLVDRDFSARRGGPYDVRVSPAVHVEPGSHPFREFRRRGDGAPR